MQVAAQRWVRWQWMPISSERSFRQSSTICSLSLILLVVNSPQMGLSWYHYSCKDCKCIAEP